MTTSNVHRQAFIDALLLILDPSLTSNPRPVDDGGADCVITLMPKAWCSHCTGAKLASDELGPMTAHDGRHGRSCGRCMGRIHAERQAVKPRRY